MALQGFDATYYLNAKLAQLVANDPTNWDGKTTSDLEATLASAGYTAESHYTMIGWSEGLAPNAYFNPTEYVYNKAVDMMTTGAYSGVLEAQAAFNAAWTTNPYDHYLSFGSKEGLNPSNTFDEAAYLQAKLTQLRTADPTNWTSDSTVAMVRDAINNAGMSTLTHWLDLGASEGNAGPYTPAASFTLTHSQDVAAATEFNAPRVWDPSGDDTMNSLQDDDVLTGTGSADVLNFTYSTDTQTFDYSIMPTMTSIETLNISYDTSATANAILDLQDSTGVTTININRIDNALGQATVENSRAAIENISINNTNAPAATLAITGLDSALSGTDTTTVTFNNANLALMVLEENAATPDQGYETINLVSSLSANSLGMLRAEDLQTLNITGDQNLTIGSTASTFNAALGLVEATRYAAGFNNVAGSFATLDANAFTGVLDVTMGNELNAGADGTSGTSVNFALTAGTGDDNIRLAQGANLDLLDNIDGGEGANSLFIHGAANIAGTVANVQTLEIRSGHDAGAAAEAVIIDTSRVTALTTTTIRNEGQAFNVANNRWESAAENLATTLNNMTDAQAAAINYLHGTTGNNGIAGNALTVDFATNAATNTVGLTFADAPNQDTRFNMQLTSAEANSLTFTDNDTESNTVGLNSFAGVNTAITVTGGQAGTFFNLDRAANGYGFDQTGAVADARVAVAAAFTAAPVGTNISAVDTAVNAAYGYTTATGQHTVFNNAAGGELLTTTTIDASGTASDVIVRVGAANQTITTNTGNDTIIFADTAGISNLTSGLTISDTVSMGTGTDTLILDGRNATINVGASEWTNLSGVDVLRLAGAPAATVFQVQITDQFVNQADNGSNLVIINNDGDLRNANENAATIDITAMAATNGITFIGADGDGSAVQAGTAVQTIVLDDVTANGKSTLDGGDRNIVTGYTATEFGTQAAADAAYLANVAANVDGNDNIFRVNSGGTNAEVTVGDLANVTNFSTIQWVNDAAVSRDMTLTLDSTTVGNLVDASHAANTTAVETLKIEAVDSTTVVGATADMILAAGTVSSSYALQVMAGRGVDTITTGAGNDTVVMAGGYIAGTYGIDATTGFDMNARSSATAAIHNVTDTVTMGAGVDTLITYGAINLAGATLAGIEAIVANSALVINLSDWNAMVAAALAAGTPTSDLITFQGNSAHQLTIVNDVAGGGAVDLSRVNLAGGSLTYDVTTSTSGAGTGTITTSSTVDIPATNPTGVAVAGNVGTAPANGGTPTAGIVNLMAAGTYTGTAGVDEQFTGTIASLNGTTVTGNASDTDTLVLTDAGTVALNNGTTGGTLDNLDTVRLADGGINNVSFAAGGTTNSFSGITGGDSADNVAMLNFGAGGAVNLGAGDDALTGLTVAQTATANSTWVGGIGTDTVTFAAAQTYVAGSLTGFSQIENIDFNSAANGSVVTLADGIQTITGANAGTFVYTATSAQAEALTGLANTGAGTLGLTISDAASFDLTDATLANNGNNFVLTLGNFTNSVTLTEAQFENSANDGFSTITGGTGTDTLVLSEAGTFTAIAGNAGASIEALAAEAGTAAINIEDDVAAAVRTITGNAGVNTIDIQGTENTAMKTIDLSAGGADTVMIDAGGVGNNLITINGFSSDDTIDMDTSAVTATVVTNPAAAVTDAAAGAATNLYVINTAAAQVNGVLTQTGDGGAVENAIIAAQLSTSTGTNTNEFYVGLDNGTDTGIYRVAITQGGTAGLIDTTGELAVSLVGIIDNVDASGLASGNFA